MIFKLRRIWYTISFLLFAGSLIVIGVWGLPLGIDFTGGNLAEITTELNSDQITTLLGDQGITAQTQATDSGGVLVRYAGQDTNVSDKDSLTNLLTGQGIVVRFESVGPAVSLNLQKKALAAIIISSIAIILYLAWAFRTVSHSLSSWSFGLVAVIALLHDLVIMTGVFAVLGHLITSISVDSYFITALLTIMGYSVNDTIVIFDRIRENVRRGGGDFAKQVSNSINQTLGRSLNTSLTVLFVLIPLLALGSGSLSSFLLALTIGVVVGTYSSICLAAPLLATWYGRRR